eukprot:8761482-Pyramimonas_sp.AAC.1
MSTPVAAMSTPVVAMTTPVAATLRGSLTGAMFARGRCGVRGGADTAGVRARQRAGGHQAARAARGALHGDDPPGFYLFNPTRYPRWFGTLD